MNQARKRLRGMADAWIENAIAKSREDPELLREEAYGNLCIPCMMSHPCLCDKERAVRRMRTWYEANRRTLFRREPKLTGSWGVDLDGLMTGLYDLATEAYRAEINRLRK